MTEKIDAPATIECGNGFRIRFEPQIPEAPIQSAATGVIELDDGTYICEVAQCEEETQDEHRDRCQSIAYWLHKGHALTWPRPKARRTGPLYRA